MNPEQIDALIKDLKDRAAQHAANGNADGDYYFDVTAMVVRDHADQAERAAAADPAAVFRKHRNAAKEAARAEALGFRESIRIPL